MHAGNGYKTLTFLWPKTTLSDFFSFKVSIPRVLEAPQQANVKAVWRVF